MAENTIRIMNAVSKDVNGFRWLQNARKKNKPESNTAIVTIIYFFVLFTKMKNIPSDKNAAITYKTTLANITAVSALNKK